MPEPLKPSSDIAAQRRRLRWRARRGLLENDILLTRFLDRYEARLTDPQVLGLDVLLDLTDNDLLDVLLERPNSLSLSPEAVAVAAIIRDLAPNLQP
jgi:antitoxin CptB